MQIDLLLPELATPTSSACLCNAHIQSRKSNQQISKTSLIRVINKKSKNCRRATEPIQVQRPVGSSTFPHRPLNTTHFPTPTDGVSTRQAMNILVNAAQGFDFPTWSPVVPHNLQKTKKKELAWVDGNGFCFWGIRQFTPFLENFSSACEFSLPHGTTFFLVGMGGGAGQKCAKFVGVVVYGAFELRYCLEVWFSILRLKKFQLLGSSTLRFLLNKLQCHRLCHAGTFPPSVCRFVMQKFSSQKG